MFMESKQLVKLIYNRHMVQVFALTCSSTISTSKNQKTDLQSVIFHNVITEKENKVKTKKVQILLFTNSNLV